MKNKTLLDSVESWEALLGIVDYIVRFSDHQDNLDHLLVKGCDTLTPKDIQQ